MLNNVQMVLVLLCIMFIGTFVSILLYAINKQKPIILLPKCGNMCYNVKDMMQDTEVCIDDIIHNFKLLDI